MESTIKMRNQTVPELEDTAKDQGLPGISRLTCMIYYQSI